MGRDRMTWKGCLVVAIFATSIVVDIFSMVLRSEWLLFMATVLFITAFWLSY